MRLLLVPGNNSLSNVAKALAIQEALTARGHEVRIAVSHKRRLFLKALGYDHYILPDIQESDEAGFPTVNWFNRPQGTVDCIKAEVKLLREFKPHRVLGIFRFTLKGAGYEVIEAVDGKDALTKLNGTKANMVITDLNMPNMDGIELVRALRGDPGYKFVPIVLLTTESQDAKKQEGKAAGATGWIVKPFKPEQLLAVVKKVLR